MLFNYCIYLSILSFCIVGLFWSLLGSVVFPRGLSWSPGLKGPAFEVRVPVERHCCLNLTVAFQICGFDVRSLWSQPFSFQNLELLKLPGNLIACHKVHIFVQPIHLPVIHPSSLPSLCLRTTLPVCTFHFKMLQSLAEDRILWKMLAPKLKSETL